MHRDSQHLAWKTCSLDLHFICGLFIHHSKLPVACNRLVVLGPQLLGPPKRLG